MKEWAEARRASFDAFLQPLFTDVWPAGFGEACRYPLFSGGKRMRPLLAIAAYEAVSKEPLEGVMPAAAAVELIHTYSLVHDDLPAMDDDDVRRGRPTVHKQFDEATAILVGDALLTEAFAVLAAGACAAGVRVALMRELAAASGCRGMVGGQAGDIGVAVEDEATLSEVHRRKTGALLRGAVRMGAISGRATPAVLEQLTSYGEDVGLAFQLADDVLDADEAEVEGSPSYVRLLGLEATQARAEALATRAIAVADALESPILAELARYTVSRDV